MMTAKLFQLLPSPLLTVDQLKLLNYDNVVSGKYKTNFEIGVPAKKFLVMKLKNTPTCGERVVNIQKKIM